MASEREETIAIEDDDELIASLREKRIQELKKKHEEIKKMSNKEHGKYTEIIKEKEFLELTTQTKLVVAHFFHSNFTRCKIMDKHLEVMSKKYFDTKFVKINVEAAPFFVEKLSVKVLPCLISFVDGQVVDRLVGFEELGNNDDFPTKALEFRLLTAEVLKEKEMSS